MFVKWKVTITILNEILRNVKEKNSFWEAVSVSLKV